ncbi:hypothetical protein SNK03_004605 [Fusarium graminearum]
MLNRLSHNNLSLTSSVVLSRVKEVDSKIISLLHASKRLLIFRVAAVCQPAAQANGAHMESRAPEAAVDHASISGFSPSHCDEFR